MDQIELVGVIVDNKLNFERHVSKICWRVSQQIAVNATNLVREVIANYSGHLRPQIVSGVSPKRWLRLVRFYKEMYGESNNLLNYKITRNEFSSCRGGKMVWHSKPFD
jgi:hypothetical protein